MTTLSALIKKELKKAFPGIKFSVTTKCGDVRVEWEMTLGTAATKQAVKDICKRHETVEHHGSLIDDTAWSSGISIYCYASHTQERENWAVAGVIDYKFADATWDSKHERFVRANGDEHYHATQLYYSYRDNGVASVLVDEYGNEPSAKRWYYEKLNPPAPQPEREQVEPEIEAPIVPLRVYKVEDEVYIQANFPSGNKRHWIDEYRSQPTNVCQAKIVKVVHLTSEDYQRFIYSFLNNQEWLVGEGGGGSHYVSEKYGNDWDKLFSDELETEKWRRDCYEVSVLVTDGEEYVLANPEGHNYARYVGLPHERTLESIIGKTDLKLATASPAPNAISQLGTQAEKPQPEGKSEVLGLDSCVITEKYRIKVTDVRTETVTGQLLDDKDNLILEYGHPVYVCVRKSEILSSGQPQQQPESLSQSEAETTPALPIALETDKEKCVKVAKEIWSKMFDSEPTTTPASHLFKVGDRIQHNEKGTARVIWVGTQEIKVENNNDEFFLLKLKSFYKKGWEILETLTKPVKPIAPAQPETLESETNTTEPDLLEITQKTAPISPKQPEPQPVAQPQGDDSDSFYLQNYQGWVNKLVARGEYGKIKSYEEWYAIAVEVM